MASKPIPLPFSPTFSPTSANPLLQHAFPVQNFFLSPPFSSLGGSSQIEPSQFNLSSQNATSSLFIQSSPLMAPVYFVINPEEQSHPFCIVMQTAPKQPTVSDFSQLLHQFVFFQCDNIALQVTFMAMKDAKFSPHTFQQDSLQPIPYDNRENLIFVKRLNQDIAPFLPKDERADELFRNEGIDEETITILSRNDITLENMKFLSLETLESIGIRSWGKRIAVLSTIRHFYKLHGISLVEYSQALSQHSVKRVRDDTYAFPKLETSVNSKPNTALNSSIPTKFE